ncbi:sensor histidine kinase [Changchengzhania lutea]|uniref:sensor histidine kinase n=1 Tax=Changchengzhania lutea TaxID=2049305 RepID=UPI00115EECD0|nr:HAMP domain-containing sensor histidine kinase [Changchengzhania lutea]
MNTSKYRWLLYIIVSTIALTIVVQGYWNYKNYLRNKQNFINQVQISFDNALDTYYADLAESNQMTFIDIESDSLKFKNESYNNKADSIFLKFLKIQHEIKSDSNLDMSGFTQITGNDSGFTYSKSQNKITQIKVLKGKKASDSIKLVKGIKSIFISIQNDTLDFQKLKPIMYEEFKRKQLDFEFALKHYKKDSIINGFNSDIINPEFLKTASKSTFLKQNETLELLYPNATKIILKRSLLSILLSLLFVIAIVSCLFYLLIIINKQKQLAEVKNDLINNITHEFKTPIATIGVALESIKNFSVLNDPEKTKRYLDMSTNQLSKLNVMVEKLLETATLDSENLHLIKEAMDINLLLTTIAKKHEIQTDIKSITYLHSQHPVMAKVDAFHFENAINNILDNAIKYGGDAITISLNQNPNAFRISISDNGNTLEQESKDKIFEKFYRVPKGNTHDVKGFGIGLYYTKKIIEKHGGSIQLDLKNNLTTFNLSLPNE